MDSSNSSCNYNNPICFTENDSPTLFSYFPNSPNTHLEYDAGPYCHYHLYNQFLDSHHQTSFTAPNIPTNNMTTSALDYSLSNQDAEKPQPPVPPKSRPPGSKKDRHSKINTAQGPRDRRMRLSLDVARKFFDLQDMLGFDKASRTVDWLLRSSWTAITDFKRGIIGNTSGSTISEECTEDQQEVVSSGLEDPLSGSSSENLKKPDQSCHQKRNNKKGKVVIARATVEKESRRKARERARDRTSQKRRLAEIPCTDIPLPNQILCADDEIAVVDNSIFYADVVAHQENVGIFHPHLAEYQFYSKQLEAYDSSNFSG